MKNKEYMISEEPKLLDEPSKNRYTPQSMEVAKEFGNWSVTKGGDMSYNYGRYFIERESLKDDDLICHLFSKSWIDWNEFIPAYYTACKINKIEHVNIRIFYRSALSI